MATDLITSNFYKGKQTFIVCLTFPDITDATNILERVSYGGDVWELRVDLLQQAVLEDSSQIPPTDYVRSQLSRLQTLSQLPILFTIRTVSQGGKFPDGACKEALELMLAAIEQGCEYVDVECTWPSEMIQEITKRKGTTRIVASLHDWTGNLRFRDAWSSHHRLLDQYGDIMKISLLSPDYDECHDMALFIRDYRKTYQKPILAVGMGLKGQLSRVINPVSLVTHPLIPFPAAPGQISLAQVHKCQHLIGRLPRQEFFIFGHNISHSLSPAIHNTAFAELGLPHNYSIYEIPQIDDQVHQKLRRMDFGGASVTFPHKLSVQKYLDCLSESATALGAVNTIIVEHNDTGRRLRGDNTDWIGILNCIQRSGVVISGLPIVVGSGGAARAAVYALQKTGCRSITLVNRTRATAQRLAQDFPSLKINIRDSLAQATQTNVIISCIPADDIKDQDIPSFIFAPGTGVVIEMSYRPAISALMRNAVQKQGWQVLGGVDVLKEQAYAQFELWTGRRAPVAVIEEALRKRMSP